jgi:UPF0042 nucleotide-binding protein
LLLGCQVLGAQQRLDALKIWDMRPLIIYQYRWFLVLLLRECRALKLPLGWTRVRAIFTTKAVLDMLAELSVHAWLSLEVVFVTASNAVLVRRFSETRRRHPLAPAETPQDGIDRERDLLNEIHDEATIVLDTSDMTPHDLRAQVDRLFNRSGDSKLAITIHSFSLQTRGASRD